MTIQNTILIYEKYFAIILPKLDAKTDIKIHMKEQPMMNPNVFIIVLLFFSSLFPAK